MTLIDLIIIYILYVFSINIMYGFELSIQESFKKSVTLPLTPFKHLINKLKPLTPLQKEIRDEERTINQLKKQKADMQRLEVLTKERESLFEEVGDKNVERVGVKRNGVWSERDARVYPSSLEWIKHDGSFAAEIGYTDNTSQVFYSGVHDLLLVEHLFRERKPINEEAVRL